MRAAVLALLALSPVPSDSDAFLQWAKRTMVPVSAVAASENDENLAPFGEMVGDASIVALGEGAHAAAEPLEFRNRVLRYLVEKKGFTAIAVESGIVEGRVVDRYVRDGDGDLPAVMINGFSWTFDQLPQNLELVKWLRAYNADPRHRRRIAFYGFDVPGSPGNPLAHRGVDSALRATLLFLDRVDGGAAAGYHALLDPLLSRYQFDLHRPTGVAGYDQFSVVERNTLTAAIADIVALLERKEAQYSKTSSTEDFEWAYRAAIGARQVDGWLRETPLDWKPSSVTPEVFDSSTEFLADSLEERDRAQADNLEWIVKHEGAEGKVLVYAHRYHLSESTVSTKWWAGSGGGYRAQQSAGTYLHERFGARLVTVGNLIARGDIACADVKRALQPAPPDSIEGLASRLGAAQFLLDLRSAPQPLKAWLDREHELGQADDRIKVALSRAYDILYYIDTVTPACR